LQVSRPLQNSTTGTLPLAEELGYHHIWIPSHHGDEYYYPNLFPLPAEDDLDKLKQLHFLGSPFVVGTPDEAVKEIERIEKMGVTHIVMQMQFGGMDPRFAEHSLRLFGEAVIGKFRNSESGRFQE